MMLFTWLKDKPQHWEPFARVVTKAALTFKTSIGRPAMISNPGLPRENPVLSHWATGTVLHSLNQSLTHSDSPNDIVHYRLARKHKNES